MSKTSSILNSKYLGRISVIAIALVLLSSVLSSWFFGFDVQLRKVEYFKENMSSMDAVSLGNSHAQSFHFESLGLVGYHFLELNGDVEETYRKALRIIPIATNLKYVLIPSSPGSFQFSQRHVSPDYEKRRFHVRKETPFSSDVTDMSLEELVRYVSYRLFPAEHIQNEFFKIFGYSKKAESIDSLKSDRCFKRLSQDQLNLAAKIDIEEGLVGGYRRILLKPQCISEFADHNSKARAVNVRKSLEKQHDVLDDNIKMLHKIADIAQSEGVKVIFVQTPVTREYYESEHFDTLMSQYQLAVEKISSHSNVYHLDFHDSLHDVVSDSNNDYFHDDSHLALVGAKHFSRLLSEKIAEIDQL